MSHSRTRSNVSSTPTYSQKLNAFVASAWSKYDAQEMSLSTWARAHTRVFYHEMGGSIPFATLYSQFMNYATEASAPAPAAVATRTPLRTAVFAEKGKPTVAENKAGASQLNAILYGQYSTWWDAFVAEAEEDTEEDICAHERFSLHCAKVLSKKTGIPVDSLVPVVDGWLLLKNA